MVAATRHGTPFNHALPSYSTESRRCVARASPSSFGHGMVRGEIMQTVPDDQRYPIRRFTGGWCRGLGIGFHGAGRGCGGSNRSLERIGEGKKQTDREGRVRAAASKIATAEFLRVIDVWDS
jgi:hypothetical protein